MNKAIKDLNPGERFAMSSTHGTVYTVESVRSGHGMTTVYYTVSDSFNMFTKPSLTTATVVD